MSIRMIILSAQSSELLRLIPLALMLALFIIFIGLAMNASTSSSVSSGRREFIKGVTALGVVSFLVAVLAPISTQQLYDAAEELGILTIDSGETYTVRSGTTETYEGVNAESGGTLALEDSATLEITES